MSFLLRKILIHLVFGTDKVIEQKDIEETEEQISEEVDSYAWTVLAYILVVTVPFFCIVIFPRICPKFHNEVNLSRVLSERKANTGYDFKPLARDEDDDDFGLNSHDSMIGQGEDRDEVDRFADNRNRKEKQIELRNMKGSENFILDEESV